MTKRADYALLALSHLALEATAGAGRLLNTKEIADHYEIPAELLAKILQVLAKHSIVSSHPGPTGGYRLTQDPRNISVAQVLNIVDGPLSLLHCSNGQESSCRQFDRCTIRNPLAEVENRVKELLDKTSIFEISGAAASPKFGDHATRSYAAGIPISTSA